MSHPRYRTSLRFRITLIMIFVMLMPFSLPLTAYIYLKIANSSSRLVPLTSAPITVQKSLGQILERQRTETPPPWDITPSGAEPETTPRFFTDPDYPSLLTVIYGAYGPLYIHPKLSEFLKTHPMDFPPNGGYQNQWAVMAQMHAMAGGTGIGSFLFEYEGQQGIAFYRFRGEHPLALIGRHPLMLLAILFFLFILIPVLLSGRFLLSLRRHLSTLERAALRMGARDWGEPLKTPSEEELQPLFAAFEQMRKDMKETQDQKSRFLMAISHDLKTPLTSLRGFTEALQEGLLFTDEERNHAYEVLLEKEELLQQRIGELVEFARMETVDWQKNFAPIALKPFLQELAEKFQAEAELRSRRWEAELFPDSPADSPVIRGDRRMLLRALENLLDNALRYTPEGTLIRLSAHIQGSSAGSPGLLEVVMEDAGPGVSSQDEGHIFESFYRGDPGRNSPGFGLGLASVKSITEHHGGTLTFSPSPLGGARFILVFPLTAHSSS